MRARPSSQVYRNGPTRALGNEDAKRVADSRLVSPALLPSRAARTAPALTRSPFGPRGLAWVALGVERWGSAARRWSAPVVEVRGRRVAEPEKVGSGEVRPDVLAFPPVSADVRAAGSAAPGPSPVDASCWGCCWRPGVTQRALRRRLHGALRVISSSSGAECGEGDSRVRFWLMTHVAVSRSVGTRRYAADSPAVLKGSLWLSPTAGRY